MLAIVLPALLLLYPGPQTASASGKGRNDDLARALERFRAGDASASPAIVAAGENAIDGLVAILRDTSLQGMTRFVAANLLGDIGSPKAVDPLLEALRDDYFNVRRCAAGALGRIGDERARPALEKLAAEDPFEFHDEKTGETRCLVREDARAALETLAESAKQAEVFLEDASKPPPSPVKVPLKRLPWPFPGRLREQFLYNNYQQPTDAYVHAGLDLLQEKGTPARAVDDGFVAGIATNYPDWRTHHFFIVTPEPGGDIGWSYTHLDPDSYGFKTGDRIRRGQVVGKVVDFSVGKNDGIDHLHLNLVRFTRKKDGAIDPASLVSLVDPLLFFDWEDGEAPSIEPRFRFVRAGTLEEFPAGKDGVPRVSGAVDLIVGISDNAWKDQNCTWMVPVVAVEVRGAKSAPWRKLVLDQRGEVAKPTAAATLYLTHAEKAPFTKDAPPLPVVHYLRAMRTDGDGAIEPSDAKQHWDTAAKDAAGNARFPNAVYEVVVRAWDLKGNRAERSAKVRVENP